MNIEKVFLTGKEVLTDKNRRILFFAFHGFYDYMDDEAFIRKVYQARMGKVLNLDNPRTFNEKLQWLKIHNRKPEYTIMVDKYEVKKYVSNIIGEEHIIPTLGVWDRFDDIDFDLLPKQFVLKCTHDSGGLLICRDKDKFDFKTAKKKMNHFMKHDYFLQNREWPYKNVKHRIIAEKYMENTISGQLCDYKFFCFDGKVKCMKVDFDRFIEHHANYFDENGNLLYFGETICPPIYERKIVFPDNIDKMKKFAEKLTVGQPFLRADFYDVDGEVYFGELTFYPASGMGSFTSEEWDYQLGEWIKLPGMA